MHDLTFISQTFRSSRARSCYFSISSFSFTFFSVVQQHRYFFNLIGFFCFFFFMIIIRGIFLRWYAQSRCRRPENVLQSLFSITINNSYWHLFINRIDTKSPSIWLVQHCRAIEFGIFVNDHNWKTIWRMKKWKKRILKWKKYIFAVWFFPSVNLWNTEIY